ncbi:MAG: SH3 domain-containing protein [Bacteroidales bacterium]|nr:SH3 domain-containing protein [Bacteroidales bacterium]
MQKGRVISTTGLNLRIKPNGEKVGVLSHNEEFTIVDEVAFFRVKTKNGQVGYVHSDYVEKIPSSTLLSKAKTDTINPRFKEVVFSNDSFIGEAARVDQDFVPDLDRLAKYALQCKLKIWVTSSIRPLNNQIRGAIVKPATHSCHHIGHAIDMNLFFKGKIINSGMMKKSNHKNLAVNISEFFELIRKDKFLRWGGDFRAQDTVHIDNDFYYKQKIFYQSKLDSRVSQSNP